MDAQASAYFTMFWREENWGRDFGYRDSIYSLGYHIGQDILCRDSFGRASAGITVPALAAGVVYEIGYSSRIGHYIIIKVGERLYDTYCHQRNFAVRVGDQVAKGQGISESAGSQDEPGSAWDAPHLHFVRSTSPYTAWNPVGSQVIDPRPAIRAALSSTAATDVETFPENSPEPTQEEEDEMQEADFRRIEQTTRSQIADFLTVPATIKRIFADRLGRAASEADVEYRLAQVFKAATTADGVTAVDREVKNSDEAVKFSIRGLFTKLLGREPSAKDYTFYLAAVRAASSVEAGVAGVEATIRASGEFKNRTK